MLMMEWLPRSSPKTRKFVVDVKQDEDGWLVATVQGLPGVHTQAKTLAELEERISEAIMLYHELEDPPSRGRAARGRTGGSKRPRLDHGTFTLEVPA
jgi:predicted RNase H-like HicB family nuclease